MPMETGEGTAAGTKAGRTSSGKAAAETGAKGPRGEKLRRLSPTDEAMYQDLYRAIIEHHLPPGSKLSEDSLAEVFGVSRTRISKVLQRLAHENIVSLYRNRGAFVARPSIVEAREVFAARRLLEAGIITAFADRATPGDLQALGELVRSEQEARTKGDHRTVIKLSGEFHLFIAEGAGNRTLSDFLRELVSRSSLVIALYQAPGGTTCDHNDHAEIIARLAEGDRDGAVAAMTRHLQEIEDDLMLDAVEDGPINLKEVFQRLLAGRSA